MKNIIKRVAHVSDENVERFYSNIVDAIRIMQNEKLNVEIQYQDNGRFSAMILGRD